ncbi:MAG: radical SAM family heme chaperone HemW [Bacilli bacterium]|nr:radical SAM family heme chaperone HemW [Bacilli bacterium]
MIRSVYVHIPFCEKICSYCDFCKMFYNEKLVDRYLEELEKEIDLLYDGDLIKSLYIGGGTPSSLNLKQLKRLLDILSKFKRNEFYEFTIECNFSNINKEKLELFKEYGVNRLSFGLETTNSKHLDFLERDEKVDRTINIIKLAKDLGFSNINVDLMYALPGESLDELRKDLEFIKSLDIEHVSCYSLIIEEHTKLGIKNVENIDSDLDFEMYQAICSFMKDNGFKHYEISNYSKEGYESKHNLVYWNNEEYYGFGLGASGYINNRRTTNTRSISNYLKGSYLLEEEILEKDDLVYYEIMLNLRKSEGIDLDKLYSLYKVKLDYEELLKLGMLEYNDNRLYIPEDKWYISNDIILRLLEGVLYE